jgi:hypothetical protein
MTVIKSTMLAAAVAMTLIGSAMAQSTTTTITTYLAPYSRPASPQSDSGYAQPASSATVQTGESGGG